MTEGKASTTATMETILINRKQQNFRKKNSCAKYIHN